MELSSLYLLFVILQFLLFLVFSLPSIPTKECPRYPSLLCFHEKTVSGDHQQGQTPIGVAEIRDPQAQHTTKDVRKSEDISLTCFMEPARQRSAEAPSPTAEAPEFRVTHRRLIPSFILSSREGCQKPTTKRRRATKHARQTQHYCETDHGQSPKTSKDTASHKNSVGCRKCRSHPTLKLRQSKRSNSTSTASLF